MDREELAASRRGVRILGALALVAGAATVMAALASATLPVRRSIDFPAPDPDTQLIAAFFGESGCAAVCPHTMAVLRSAYRRYTEGPPRARLGVVFVELDGSTAAGAAEAWARAFDGDFRVVRARAADPDDFLRQLGVRSGRLGDFGVPAHAHSAFIYLLRRETDAWVLRRVYRQQPPDADALLALMDDLQ